MASKPNQPRTGATRPRLENTPLKGITRGGEVAQLAEDIGLPLLPWQSYVLNDLLTIDKNKQFIRKTALVLCARQNGKSHLARMRILGGLFLFNERNHVIISSARAMALTTFREVVDAIEAAPQLKAQLKQVKYTNGAEAIILKSGARLDVKAATRDSARGATADFLFIDELREVDELAYSAALPVTRARPNAQTLLCSNAGDAFSVTLNELRERCLSHPPESMGYYEYSAPQFAPLTSANAGLLRP